MILILIYFEWRDTENQQYAEAKGSHLIKTVFFSIKTVRFADYKATSASSVKGVQLMMDKMQEIAEEYGMKTKVMKTKLMKISTLVRNSRSFLRVNN